MSIKNLFTDHKLQILMALLFASGLSVVMYLARVLYVDSWTYRFLVWNLFLAWLPLLFAALAYRFRQRWTRLLLFSGLWLLFLPNSPYIITDLMHLSYIPSVPAWYDAVMVFSFALTGLLLGFVSLFVMQMMVLRRYGRSTSWVFALATLGMSGFGVYIGRFLRWNSWDIFTNPLTLFNSLFNPDLFLKAFVVTGLLSTIFVFSYIVMFSLPRLSVELAGSS
jgi:uncharacterized membrane protein